MVIELYKRLQAQGERVLSKQLLRCGTSIGANVEEADAGSEQKGFPNKDGHRIKRIPRDEILAQTLA